MEKTDEKKEDLENQEKNDKEDKQEKLFTQEEVDRIVSERIFEEREKNAENKKDDEQQAGGKNAKTGVDLPYFLSRGLEFTEADKLIIEKFGLAEEDGSIDSLMLSRAKAEIFDEGVEKGVLRSLESTPKSQDKVDKINSVMRGIFGLPEKKRR